MGAAGLRILRSRFFQRETLALLDYFMLVGVGGPKSREQAYILDRRLDATQSLELPLCLSHFPTLIVLAYYLAERHLPT